MPSNTTTYTGTLVTWNEEKAFGFIKSDQGRNDVFLHIGKIRYATRDPKVGDTIQYQLEVGKDGKSRAVNARIEGATGFLKSWHWVLIGFCLLGAIHLLWQTTNLTTSTTARNWFPLNLIPLTLYLLMSSITYILYARDKYYALNSSWRIQEKSLHLAEALGGWPGALMAQRSFRHKSVKKSYQQFFWFIVILHIGGWIAWFWWQISKLLA
jgi:uncharacterized membrane protein YsdA (DUF1294 family)/cold shock CspA family protein